MTRTRPYHREPTPFALLEAHFQHLCADPDPLTLSGHAIRGLPDRPIRLDELRGRLLHPACRHATRDAAIGHLLARAHTERGPWPAAIGGVLLPGLRAAIEPLVAVCPQQTADIEAEALAGLIAAIGRTHAGHPRTAARLCWLARNQARRLVHAELAELARPGLDPAVAEPARQNGHPDLVLADAVAGQVICPDDAALIGDTRLGLINLADAAGILGISYTAAHQRRLRAETALIAWLTDRPPPGPARPPSTRIRSAAANTFVEKGAKRPCSAGGGRPRTGRDPDRRPAVRHPLPNPEQRR